MKTKRSNFLLPILLSLCITIFSCSTDDSTPEIKSVDFMTIIHDMMHESDEYVFTGDTDYDFVSNLIFHHETAIMLSDEEIAKGTNQQLINYAKQIRDLKIQRLSVLKDFQKNHKIVASKDDSAHVHHHLHEAFHVMHEEVDKQTLNNNSDHDYILVMPPLSQSAIDLAVVQANHGKNADLVAMAKEIMTQQKAEIEGFKEFGKDQ